MTVPKPKTSPPRRATVEAKVVSLPDPTDRALTASDSRSGGRRRSRSRSPPRRDAYNSYDDRRDDRRGGYRDRSRSPVRGAHFSPQPQRGGGRDRSPRRDDDSSEIISIDSNLVGLVIGRSGENLRRVEQETTARIQFITPPDHAGPSRQCRISGNPRARSEAKREIFRIIEENNTQGPGQGRGNANKPPKNVPPPRDAPVGEDSMKIMVPDRTVGLIIGRGGETIRDLQDRSGCHINIVAANKSVNGLRPVNLIGSPQAANKAKDLIMEIVESDTRGPQQNDSAPAPHVQYQPPAMHEPSKVNETIRVPSDAVGMIIGKGGETIRDMQNSTGCKINVSQAAGADIEREIGLVGNRQAIEAAKRAIQDKVDTVVRPFTLRLNFV
jgi:far upstream element-binding protein